MSSTLKFRGHRHLLRLQGDVVIGADSKCYVCKKPVIGTLVYTCTSHEAVDCPSFYLHKSCSDIPNQINHRKHKRHPLTLLPRPRNICDVCKKYVEFSYTCEICEFDVCVFCAFEFTHFSHPKHPLVLKEFAVSGVDACDSQVIGSPTHTCSSEDTDCDWESFYLQKSCAELPTLINHNKHHYNVLNLSHVGNQEPNKRPLTLRHECHQEHELTLIETFRCDACCEEAKDSVYVCTTCRFCIQSTCAFSPSIISEPTYHRHPLNLIYSIPEMHRLVAHFCFICDRYVNANFWAYYCHKCTLFVHIKCAFTSLSMLDGTVEDSTHNVITEDAKSHGSQKTVKGSTNKQPLTLRHESHKEHELTLILKCDACWEEVKDTSYVCTTCRFCIHSTCAFLPFIILEPTFHHHPLNLIYSIPEMHRYFMRFCFICDRQVHVNCWAYYCHKCTLFVHIKCATTSDTMVDDSKEDFIDDVIPEDAKCYGCNKLVIGSPTYTCTSCDINCKNFYLHKSCAELPEQIHHHKHNQHSLSLLLPHRSCICDVCGRKWKLFTYSCEDCQFNVCVLCAFDQRVLRHDGHKKHPLTLMKRKSLFKCDACGVEAKDSSYACTTCDFWIHKSCALSPLTIPAPAYHQEHTLNLIYSIPKIHRNFPRVCNICQKLVHTNFWLYYCHSCTYFVHIHCAASTVSIINDIEADDMYDDPDLVRFPLHNEESQLDFIIAQCAKLKINFQGEGENNVTVSIIPNDPLTIEKHWSHKYHPLELLQFTVGEDDDDDDNDDIRVLICDGCIQPINISHPSYYACAECGFFLHSFCATKLPQELPAEASTFHPQHALLLQKSNKFYSLVKCGACCFFTNGFYYHCETCDIKVDIRCAFLPARINHKSHKHHPLVQHPFSKSVCSVSKLRISSGVEYACETCSNFQIHINCVFYPSSMKHGYDGHPITLRLPPFFYKGAFYCELCEEQVNNQWWLYHCDKCDHSFHFTCLRWFEAVKLGGTIKLTINNKPHTLALVLKRPPRKNSPLHICRYCGDGYEVNLFFECDGCGFLVCRKCVIKIFGDYQVSGELLWELFVHGSPVGTKFQSFGPMYQILY